VQVGDFVLIKEENLPRSRWTLGRVTATRPGRDQLVRSISIRTTSDSNHNGKRIREPIDLERPVQKVVVLVESPET
jgi:hypothetical protein